MHYNLADNETKFLTIYLSANDSDFIQDYSDPWRNSFKDPSPISPFPFQHSVYQGLEQARSVLGTRL